MIRSRTLLLAPVLLLLARPAAPQAAAVRGDQPPPSGPNLFVPMLRGDLTPEQQRTLETYRADPSAGEIQVYRINLNVPRTADAININLAPGSDLMLSTRNRADRAPGDYSWTGGDPSGEKSAALVVKDSQVSGTIRDGDRLYRVRPIGGGATAVIEVDTKKLPPEHPPTFDRRKLEPKVLPPVVAPAPVAPAAPASDPAADPVADPPASATAPRLSREEMRAARAGRAAATPASAGEATLRGARVDRADTGGTGAALDAAPGTADEPAPDACGSIDVLVAYTPAAAQQSGGIEALVQLAVDETNNSYLNSGVRPRLRLVGTVPTSYVESGDMELDVARLANPSDGHLDDVPRLRDQAQADIAVLVTGNGNFCGIAADILAGAENAYAVVGQNCATGYYSFAHEVGHLQGARHNLEADPTETPFAWGHGFFSTANRRRTVMAYDCPVGCTRIDVWADPTVVVAGVPMGNPATNHDARVLNETACAIAAFRTGTGTPIAGGGTGLGSPLAPTPSTPRKASAGSTWSLLALVLLAPWLLTRRVRA